MLIGLSGLQLDLYMILIVSIPSTANTTLIQTRLAAHSLGALVTGGDDSTLDRSGSCYDIDDEQTADLPLLDTAPSSLACDA
jgi:hypothetical protein